MNKRHAFISLIKSKLVKTSLLLLFISSSAQAFLPNGKMTTYSFKEQSRLYNYKISGSVGYISHLNDIFSAENAKIIVSVRSESETSKKEIICDELTYELKNAYIICLQGSEHMTLDLKTDKWSK